MNSFRQYYFFSLLIFVTFFLGYFLVEDSSGGGSIDLITIFRNFQLFESNNLFNNFPWNEYKSTSLPLYYITSSFLFDFNESKDLSFFNLILATFCFYVFYNTLKISFPKKKNLFKKHHLCLLASVIFLSPYLRTSTFWGLEEVIGILIMLISIYYFKLNEIKKSSYTLFLCIFFTCLAFYCRQSYIFLLSFIFFSLIDYKKVFGKTNFLIVFYFIIFLIPALYTFFIWKSVFPPIDAAHDRLKLLLLYHLPYIFNIILIYIIPFILLQNLNEIKKFLISNKYLFLIAFLLNLLLFNFIEISSNGGGAMSKIMIILLGKGIIFNLIFSLTSSISFFLIYFICLNSKKLTIFFISIIFTFLNISTIFQEYFDPIVFVFLLVFFPYKKLNYGQINRFTFLTAIYYSAFLISALFYYYKIL